MPPNKTRAMHAPSARCSRCLAFRVVQVNGRVALHKPCGAGQLPAPTAIGAELDGVHPFPADVTQVVDRDGRWLERRPTGWWEMRGVEAYVDLQLKAHLGPYRVMEIKPE